MQPRQKPPWRSFQLLKLRRVRSTFETTYQAATRRRSFQLYVSGTFRAIQQYIAILNTVQNVIIVVVVDGRGGFIWKRAVELCDCYIVDNVVVAKELSRPLSRVRTTCSYWSRLGPSVRYIRTDAVNCRIYST